MGNTFNVSSMLWEVSEIGTLVVVTTATGLTSPVVAEVVLIPNAASDAITFQSGSSETALYLKAGASDTSPVHLTFPEGRCIPGLKCSAISTSAKAYVYLI